MNERSELPPCPGCKKPASGVLIAAPKVDVVRCERCGLVYSGSGLETDTSFYDYYAKRTDLPEETLYLPLTTDRLRAVLDDLRKRAPGARLLDVGCGEGQLLRAATRAGWDAKGLDLSPSAVAICQRFGLDAETIDFFDDALPLAGYDAITMIEFLEHISDPVRFLRRAAALLAPGGVVYLTTPNFASFGRRVLGPGWPMLSPAHLLYLTPQTIRRVAGEAGLDVRRITTRNLSAAAINKLRRRRVSSMAPPPPGTEHVGAGFGEEQRLRNSIESSPVLRTVKRAVNGILAATGTGETITAWLSKPR